MTEFGWVRELNEGVKRIYDDMEEFFFREIVLSISLSCYLDCTITRFLLGLKEVLLGSSPALQWCRGFFFENISLCGKI